MSAISNSLSKAELGQRLRLAREGCGLTQSAAAEKAGFARTTLVAIEQGKRSVKDSEIYALVDIYKISLNTLLRRDAIHVDLIPRFRKLADDNIKGVNEAAEVLNELVTAEVELENILGVNRKQNLPIERPLLPGDVRTQAEDDALELRNWIGLGNNPVRDIFGILDLDMGVRVYSHPLSGKISGLFAYEDSVGACILINSNHPYERQVQTSGHELGHIVSARHRTDVCQDGHQSNSREERYATAFALAFLMPARTVMQKFSEITAGAKQLTRRHVIILANYFGVSREALVRRLEDLKLTADGTWDWFVQNGGISNAQADEVLGVRRKARNLNEGDLIKTSLRLETLAAQALERELLSEGQVARLLKLDRTEVRRLQDVVEDSENGPHKLSG